MILTNDLVRRMQQVSVLQRYDAKLRLDEVLAGTYEPLIGWILPPWKEGSSRRTAFARALRKTQTEGPRVLSERLASGVGGITVVNANTGEEDERITEALDDLHLDDLAKECAQDYISHGIVAVLPYEDQETNEPRLERLGGLIEPYTDPLNANRVTGLYRTMSYLTRGGKVRWRTEVYDWEDSSPTEATHRYWTDLEKPTNLSDVLADELPAAPRPAWVIDRMTHDGLPIGQLETALPFLLGLYATELMLATSEEIGAYPMLKVKGSTKGIKFVGPAEVIGVDRDGEAEWMQPGNLGQLSERRNTKREQVREAGFLYAGSLGTETPSGEALIQANRVPQQADGDVADAIGRVLTDAVTRYLELRGLPAATVTITPDQAYERRMKTLQLEVLDNIGAVPLSVKARIAQTILGGEYSDQELEDFIEENRRPTLRREPGEIA